MERQQTRGKKGSIAGNNTEGYIKIMLCRRSYFAHRLSWLYMTGVLPDFLLDHKNGIGSDNRWDNLRRATTSENSMNKPVMVNNKMGIKGVCKNPSGTFRAYASKNGKRIRKTFKTIDEAVAFSVKARNELHGDFCRHK